MGDIGFFSNSVCMEHILWWLKIEHGYTSW
jgi:hypothetical protein